VTGDRNQLDMNQIVGSHNILFLTLDTLRLDAALREYDSGGTPTFAQLFTDGWEHRHSPASFTFGAHTSFFAGFLPTPAVPGPHPRNFAMAFPGSETTAPTTAVFDTPDLVTGLSAAGYRTICIGGVGFFNKLTPLGSQLPSLFQESFWDRTYGVTDPRSFANQVELAQALLAEPGQDRPTFLFINVAALHQPNLHYLAGATEDTLESHRAALRYVDSELAPLLAAVGQDRPCLVMAMSDHGTAYGDDGYVGHRIGHHVVWDVPYAETVIEQGAWS